MASFSRVNSDHLLFSELQPVQKQHFFILTSLQLELHIPMDINQQV